MRTKSGHTSPIIICAFLPVPWSGVSRGLSISLIVSKESTPSFTYHLYWFSLPVKLVGDFVWCCSCCLVCLVVVLSLPRNSSVPAFQLPSQVATNVISFYVSFQKILCLYEQLYAFINPSIVLTPLKNKTKQAVRAFINCAVALTPFYNKEAYCPLCPAY